MNLRKDTNKPISLEHCEILSEISVDNFHFKATLNPFQPDTCILWFADSLAGQMFKALGRFTRFDKRAILEFVARYATTAELRVEIDRRRFESRIQTLSITDIHQMSRMKASQRERAFMELFDLDAVIEQRDIDRKRKAMARRFHPDLGGDLQAMTVINEAYDFLNARARN